MRPMSRATKELYEELLNAAYQYRRWDKEPAHYLGTYGNIPYYNHNQDVYNENKAYYIFRNLGDSVTISALGGKYNETLLKIIESAAKIINTDKHYSNAPLYLLGGYYSMLNLK